MEQNEFVLLCRKIFRDNRIACSAEQAERLYQLTVRMLEINSYMNLTAITDEKAVILRHYVDSLIVLEQIPHSAKVLDVGCGAGFPSLPLAIFRPDLRITSLDATAKRIAYVAETAKMLELPNLTAVVGRAEEYALRSDYREQFDTVVARAVASLPVLSELCLPFVRKGGRFLAMKSRQIEEEIALSKNAISLCGGALTEVLRRELLSEDLEIEQRAVACIEKTEETPKKYPRHFSKISKNPL